MLEYKVLEFKDAKRWRQWLLKHHNNTDGIWLRFYKKASNIPTVTYAEALDEALCFGWIDGQGKKLDEVSYLQKYTPRRARSIWSKRNIEHVERLTRKKLMMPAGFAEVEKAKADGCWDLAYETQKKMVVPDDFISAVKADKKAFANYQMLKKSDLFSIGFKLQTAKKAETRERRFLSLLEKLHRGESIR